MTCKTIPQLIRISTSHENFYTNFREFRRASWLVRNLYKSWESLWVIVIFLRIPTNFENCCESWSFITRSNLYGNCVEIPYKKNSIQKKLRADMWEWSSIAASHEAAIEANCIRFHFLYEMTVEPTFLKKVGFTVILYNQFSATHCNTLQRINRISEKSAKLTE